MNKFKVGGKVRWKGRGLVGTVVEVSAVTFPAYESTEINARGKKAVETARAAVDTARRNLKKPVDTGAELELIKLKTLYGGKI